jgi:Pectate lyase superfamily protein
MTYTLPGTFVNDSLVVPVSAANLNSYTTAVSDLDIRATRLEGAALNVKAFGAVGDGVADDTSEIQAALTAASTGGGLVYVPPGTYMLSASLVVPTKTHLIGAGAGATTLKKSASFPMLKFWGTATGNSNHLVHSGARDMTLDGGNFTGTILDLVYATQLDFYNIHCFGNADITLDTVEVWDSKFYHVTMDFCGGTTTPAIRIGSSRAASGFGLSTDSTNQLMFFGVQVENWRAGAILLNPGTGGVLLHQIYFFGMKIETSFVRGVAIDISGTTRDIHMDDMWMFMGTFDTGFSTAQNAINVHGDRNINIRGVFMANAAAATIANGFDVWNAGAYIDQAYGNFSTAPTGAMVAITGGSDYTIGHVALVGSGALFSGNVVANPVVGRPTRAISGAVTDGSYLAPPLVGTQGIDVTNNRLYVKTAAGTWHYAQLSDTPAPAPQTTFKTASYFTGNISVTTSAILGNGTLRLAPLWLSVPVGITAVGIDFSVAGDAASLFRMAIYADDGTNYPGALLLDCGSVSTGTGNAGTVATGGTPGVYMNTLGSTLSLPAGMYWVGGVLQGVTVTQPTLRVAQFMNFSAGNTAVPVAAAVSAGYSNTGITSALPSTFVAFGTNAGGIAPRIIMRLA